MLIFISIKKSRPSFSLYPVKLFVDYFTKQWLDTLPGWYEGYAPGLPSTNNALEAKNRILKDEVTQYNRYDVGRFLPLFEEDLVKQ